MMKSEFKLAAKAEEEDLEQLEAKITTLQWQEIISTS